MNCRAYLIALIACMALLLAVVQIARAIWPPDPHPLLIEAKGCPLPTPVPQWAAPQKAPIMDWRRIA